MGENSKSACISVVQITANFKDFQRENLFKILNQLIDVQMMEETKTEWFKQDCLVKESES